MFNIIRANLTRQLRSTKFSEFRRYVSSDTTSSGSSADKASFNEPTSSSENVTRESEIHKSPNWDQNVNFTLKECILYDIDRRRNNYFDHRISQTENKLDSTAIQLEKRAMQSEKRAMQSENKLLLIIIGSTVSIISSIVASNYINYISKQESKTVASNYIQQENVKMAKKE